MEQKERIVVGAILALAIYALVLSTLGPVLSSVLANRTIANNGSVKGVGVGLYWDQAATNPVSSISWGLLDPGSNISKTVYVRNEGNAPATLSITTSNWNPANTSNYMTLTWDYANQTVNANQIIQTRLTLSVSQSVAGITNFSFDITIAATSQ